MMADFELDSEFVETGGTNDGLYQAHIEDIIKGSDRTFKCVLVTGAR